MSSITLSSITKGTDETLLDVDLIFDFLHNEARWSKGIPRSTVERSISNSLCFGAYFEDSQIGFARVVSDLATFGNLVDVFVLPEYRGQGISRLLLEALNDHPDLQGLRRFMLTTSYKQSLYAKFGFTEIRQPRVFMEKFDPEAYT